MALPPDVTAAPDDDAPRFIGPASLDAARIERLRRETDLRSLPSLFAAWEALGFGRSRSPNTVELYRHACCTCGALLARDAELGVLDLWKETLLTKGPHGRKLARSSVVSVLNAATAVARRVGRALGDETLANRLDALDRPKAIRRIKAPPPSDLLPRCLEILDDRADRLWCLACRVLSCRKLELLGLPWERVDLFAGYVTIDGQRGSDHRKNQEAVVVTLSKGDEFAALLWRELRWAKGDPDAMRTRNGPMPRDAAGRVFPWGVNRLERILTKLRIGLADDWKRYFPPGDAWHQFRRDSSQATHDAGGTDLDVARVLGDSPQRARGYYRTRPTAPAPVLPGVGAPVHRPAGPARVLTDPAGTFRDVASGRVLAEGYRPPEVASKGTVVAPWDRPGALEDEPLSVGDLDWLHALGRVAPWDESDP